MRYACLLALMIPILSAQDGGAIYKERCASCHDAPAGRVPALGAIKAMSGEAIYLALTTGSMKTRAEGLSTLQIFALIGYTGPTGGTHTAAPKIRAELPRRFGVSAQRGFATMGWLEPKRHQLAIPGRGGGGTRAGEHAQT